MLVMNRGSRASKVIDLVNFKQKWLNDVVSNELKPRVTEMVHNILFPTGEKVINDDHAITSSNQTVHKVATYKTGTTGHYDPQTLTLQAQRDLPARIERPESGSVLVDHTVSHLRLSRLGG